MSKFNVYLKKHIYNEGINANKVSGASNLIDVKALEKAFNLVDSYIGKEYFSYKEDSFVLLKRKIKNITTEGVLFDNTKFYFHWEELGELPLFEKLDDCKKAAKEAYKKWLANWSEQLKDGGKSLTSIDDPKWFWNE